MTKAPYSPTANLLRDAIDATDKTQRELARAAGLPHANVLSMMKTGECKVPISRIPKLSAALGIDTLGPLPHAKSHFRRDRRSYREVLTDAQRDTIARACAPEIALMGYRW